MSAKNVKPRPVSALRAGIVLVIMFALAQPAAAKTLKIATLAPEGSAWTSEIHKGAEEIASRTSDRVKIRMYPGGTMGNDQNILRKIRLGQLHGGVVVAGSLASIYPDMQIYSLPFLFHSYQEVESVRAKMDEKLGQALAAKGYISFGLIEGGFAYFMSRKPTNSVQDLKGQKVWIPEGDVISQAMIDAAGVAPVPLPLTDVLTGLQTGLIDTVVGPPVGAVALQWFTRVSYLTDLPLAYTYGTIVLSEKAFSRLSPADQAVVTEVMSKVSSELDRRTRADNERAREALIRQGIKVVEVSAEEAKKWREVAAKARKKLAAEKVYSPKTLAEVDGYLASIRQVKEAAPDDGEAAPDGGAPDDD